MICSCDIDVNESGDVGKEIVAIFTEIAVAEVDLGDDDAEIRGLTTNEFWYFIQLNSRPVNAKAQSGFALFADVLLSWQGLGIGCFGFFVVAVLGWSYSIGGSRDGICCDEFGVTVSNESYLLIWVGFGLSECNVYSSFVIEGTLFCFIPPELKGLVVFEV